MNANVAERFRERLALLRKERNLTQHELESRIGKAESEAGYVSRLETGGIVTPPFDVIQRIAEVLEVDPIELFFGEGLHQKSEELLQSINSLLATQDAKQLRKIYRLILVSLEKYSK